MLKHAYVIDMIVRYLDAAIANGRKIFGCGPKATSGVGSGIDEFRMAHFAAPGGGGAVHSVGFFQLTTDTPQTETGQFMKHYLETRGNELEPSPFGVSFWLAEHNRDGYDQFQARPEITD